MTIDSTINLPTLFTILVAVIGAIFWLARLEGRVASNAGTIEKLASETKEIEEKVGGLHGLVLLSQNQLAEYKTHVAEHYVTKAGMAEQTDRIMKAINDVGNRVETRVDGLGVRLDRFYESQPTPSPRSSRSG